MFLEPTKTFYDEINTSAGVLQKNKSFRFLWGYVRKYRKAFFWIGNPSFLFLDEATNSLDANNERSIVENLSHFYRGRTVVIVAHRLSTVKSADSIVVLNKGRVVETGNHESLAAKHGIYYHLVKNQLDLE